MSSAMGPGGAAAARGADQGPQLLCKIELPAPGTGDDQFGGTKTVHQLYRFTVDQQLGEGTYGQVFMGHHKLTDDKVALKKIRMDTEKEGFPITAIREIKLLTSLQHPNVVNLREIVRSEIHKNNNYKGSIYMVFDYASYDLTGLMESQKYNFTEPQVKCIMKQILKGMAYCHNNGVLHRDLKASNILIDSTGTVKLADFGLARAYQQEGQDGRFTNRVITLWYRPPELLLGSDRYGPEIDMWSVGCIFAELLTGKPLFPGKDDIDQLDKIFQVMGSPSEATWPGLSKLSKFNSLGLPEGKYKQCRLRESLKQRCVGTHGQPINKFLSNGALELLESMLTLDPSKRITATFAATDQYFYENPLPCEPADLPCRASGHEFTMKKKRNEQPQGVQGHGAYAQGGMYSAQGGTDPKRPRFNGPGQAQVPYGSGPQGPRPGPQASYYPSNAPPAAAAAAYNRPGSYMPPSGPMQPPTNYGQPPGRPGSMPPPAGQPGRGGYGSGGMGPPGGGGMMPPPQFGGPGGQYGGGRGGGAPPAGNYPQGYPRNYPAQNWQQQQR